MASELIRDLQAEVRALRRELNETRQKVRYARLDQNSELLGLLKRLWEIASGCVIADRVKMDALTDDLNRWLLERRLPTVNRLEPGETIPPAGVDPVI